MYLTFLNQNHHKQLKNRIFVHQLYHNKIQFTHININIKQNTFDTYSHKKQHIMYKINYFTIYVQSKHYFTHNQTILQENLSPSPPQADPLT